MSGSLLYLLGGGAITALGSLALQAYRARTGKEGDMASTAQVLTSAATAMVLPLSARITVLEAEVAAARLRENECVEDLAKVKKRLSRVEDDLEHKRFQGKTGDTGATGATGDRGKTGAKGDQGESG